MQEVHRRRPLSCLRSCSRPEKQIAIARPMFSRFGVNTFEFSFSQASCWEMKIENGTDGLYVLEC